MGPTLGAGPLRMRARRISFLVIAFSYGFVVVNRKSGKLVNKAELAEICGVSLTSIDNWIRQGLPYVEKGDLSSPWTFDTYQVIKWKTKKAPKPTKLATSTDSEEPEAIDINEAKRRKAVAEAKLAELDLHLKQEKVILLEAVQMAVTEEFNRIRTRFLGLPAKLAPRLFQTDNPAKIQELLNKDIRATLAELTYDQGGVEN